MLKALKIRNYALIKNLDIDFGAGFTTITGETGAGKSILLGAISLLLGQRADASVLQDKSSKCYLEAVFTIKSYNLQIFFEENELDYDDETILRREILESGKSRAFVNDVPVNLSILKDLGERLVDVHSQHQNLLINRTGYQLGVLDILAQTREQVADFKKLYQHYQQKNSELSDLENRALKEKEELEYFTYQYEELEKAKLEEGETELLEQESEILSHTEEIKSGIVQSVTLLSEGDHNLIHDLKETILSLGHAGKYSPPAETLKNRLESILLEMKDVNMEAVAMMERIEFDPERFNFLKQRLDLIYSLLQKHHKTSVKELLELKNYFGDKLQEISNFDNEISKLKRELSSLKEQLKNQSEQLTQKRTAQCKKVDQTIVQVLHTLGMPHGRFEVKISPLPDYSSSGKDEVSFLFSANKNSDLQSIEKVASGGEISRLMLAIKYLVSSSAQLPCIILDEIDTGVSGEIADKMALLMKQMSQNMQVISITHLPQIASKGDQHFQVYKDEENHHTETKIKHLNPSERITEIAKMLSGSSLSNAAMENARILLQTN